MGIYYKLIDEAVQGALNAVRGKYHDVRYFVKNIPIFIKLCWYWRDFDSHYSINVFAKLIMENGKACKRYDNHLASEKQYRKACRIAGNIERAYNSNVYDDRGLMYLTCKYPIEFVKTGDSDFGTLYTLETNYKNNKYAKDLIKRKQDRCMQRIAKNKQEAWEFLHKHIEGIWD